MADHTLGTDDTICEPGAIPFAYWTIKAGSPERVDGGVIAETFVSIYVNGQDLATLMCSPLDQEDLVVGFLFNEGVIASVEEIGLIRPNANETTIDVFLTRREFNAPRRMVLTSGCGGGISFQNLAETQAPLESAMAITPQVILDRMADLNQAATLYKRVRGVHTSVLASEQVVLFCAEDVGRHNTIDKLAGKAMRSGVDMRDRLLVTSGRISSEMLSKARQMGVPIVASRTAPTSISVGLAEAWNMCVVGYVRQGSMRVYTHAERLGLDDQND